MFVTANYGHFFYFFVISLLNITLWTQKVKSLDFLKTYEIKIGNENIELGCSVRNQQLLRDGEYYLISKNQIDDTVDRQVDLSVSDLKNGGLDGLPFLFC